MFDFSDQVALVTGASRGIGREIARQLASRGARVILCSRTESDLAELTGEIEGAGGKAVSVPMDVSRTESIEEGLRRSLEAAGRVDVLVNNAGITRDNLLLRMKDEEWKDVVSTNLDSLFYLTRAVVKGMVRSRYGRIVNVSSVVAQTGNPGQVNYVASKAGMIGFTRALAREVASRGVTVNAVAPGFIRTDMTSALGQEAREGLLESIPLKRMGTPADVAYGVLFLASKDAGYITGHVLNINGGMHM